VVGGNALCNSSGKLLDRGRDLSGFPLARRGKDEDGMAGHVCDEPVIRLLWPPVCTLHSERTPSMDS
jgi:hypothetical protein